MNPLEQFVSIDERPDGVYVKVTRAEKESLRMDLIRSAMENAFVMNFDSGKFEDVVMRARGVFERIGPVFEIYNQDIEKYLQVTITAQKAVLKVNSGCLAMGKRPSEKTLVYYLNRKGISHGVNIESIRDLIADNKWDEFWDVAEIVPPVSGFDSKIEMLISIDPNLQPTVRSDGSVDYRDIRSFTSVTKGQSLAVKHPPTPGKPGIGLGGEELPPTPGLDHKLPNGKNTEISADGLYLLASKTGIVYLQNGMINIVEMLNINGNVDFNVGNVKYSGDVLICGSVMPGFSVEAEGTVHIKGEVESARVISRNGRVIVEKGILGKGDTQIKAKTGIVVSFAQEAELFTDGLLTFDKFLMHCDCTCEVMEGHGHNASIIGGIIKAERTVTVKQVGTEKCSLTKIMLFDKHHAEIEEKIKELIILDKKLKTELEPVEKQLKTKMALLKRTDEVSGRAREEVKKWVDAYNLIAQKIKYVAEKIASAKKELDGPQQYEGFVYVQGLVFAGTELEIYGVKYSVTSTMSNKRFRVINSGIQAGE